MKTFNRLLQVVPMLCVVASLLTACQPSGGSSLPVRKKMPEFNDGDAAFEGRQPFQQDGSGYGIAGNNAFSANNVDMAFAGTTQGFVEVALPDAATDSATVGLLQNFKPFALPLLANWAKQQRHGVAIDLSGHNGQEVHRSDFQLEQAGVFSIPVVVIWDRSSAYRLSTLKSLANEIPAVKFNQVSAE